MDAVEAPRRFSTTSALLPKFDSSNKASQYGTVAQPGELEGVLAEGVQEGDAITHTTVGNESKLLFKYSLPLTLTYLLQARHTACHEFSSLTMLAVHLQSRDHFCRWTHRH